MNYHKLELGGGQVNESGVMLSLSIPMKSSGYADAQIDDTQAIDRKSFKWKPPVRLSLKARANPEQPSGTLGFGFWNDPFSISVGMKGAARRLPVPPQALWFFYASPPNDIQLSRDSSGAGWKAMSIRSPRIPGSLTLLPAAIAISLLQIRLFRKTVMATIQRVIHASETRLDQDLADWHRYEISWEQDRARFFVDGVEVLQTDHHPVGPLGFVAWIDNQYALASARSGFKFGFIPTSHSQVLELEDLQILPA